MDELSPVSPISPEDIMADLEQPRTLLDFPQEARDSVEGLMWLGYLEDEFDFCGHSFVMRTLRGDEELLASLVTKDYESSFGQDRAYAWATIALSLVSLDGDEEFCPKTGRDKRAYARARFQFCTSRWYWAVGEFLFQKYVDLQRRQTDAIRRVEDLSQGNLHTSSPSVSSSLNRADSEPARLDEIKEYLDPPDSTDSKSSSSSSTKPS